MKWATFNGGGGPWAAAKIGATLTAFLVFAACGRTQAVQLGEEPSASAPALLVGAERTSEYIPPLIGRRVAVVTNQTGRIGGTHLVDSLLALKVQVLKVFAPEHGFRGDADAGEHVKDGRDARTGLPLISLYGSNKKPTKAQLADIDVLLFDIQDVGVRFYTYIGTLHYVMEAAAENGIPLIVLDRPNPNGFYVDGPVLDPAHRSFVGMHPVPLVHGMTIGEFARMINGEGWLEKGVQCDLTVVPCAGYDHATLYELPVKPSPNLPNASAVYLYPSLGLFEGTIVGVGRGTDKPFQCIGYPGATLGRYRFTPRSMPGAKDPPYKAQECSGLDLAEYGAIQARLDHRINLQWLIGMQTTAKDGVKFFTPFFDKLAGGPALREQVEAGLSEEAIRASWKEGLDRFAVIRKKYLLYP
ncbi:MAG TPA: DUF1343 domain-containing protein [Flavobacteriales bacterium]|nr:DUF1343 domain-containing protein [Flavobacteriales bacterium]